MLRNNLPMTRPPTVAGATSDKKALNLNRLRIFKKICRQTPIEITQIRHKIDEIIPTTTATMI